MIKRIIAKLAPMLQAIRRLPMKVGRLNLRNRRAKLAVVATVAVLLAGYGVLHVSADTVVLVPDGDVTNTWGGTGGTSDLSCAGGTRCDFVDEGTTDNLNDYITTAGSTGAADTQEFTLSTVSGVSSATQVVVSITTLRTVLGGGTADTLTVNLRVNGTLQTAVTITPPNPTSTTQTATFSGSWTQADVDSMQVSIVRNLLGTGSAANKADTIQLYNVYATLTYTPTLTQTQSAYRWFDNQDGSGNGFARVISYLVSDYSPVGPSDPNYTYNSEGDAVTATADGGYAMTGRAQFDFFDGMTSASGVDMYIAKYDSIGKLSWSQKWGNNAAGSAIVQTTDGGYAITGVATGVGSGGSDMLLVKYTSTGTLSWAKNWGGTGDESGYSLVQTSDGGYAVTGTTKSYGDTTNGDMFLAKYDSAGNLSWSKTWGGSGTEAGKSVVQTSDGGYAVTGGTNSFGAGGYDAFLAKYDSAGNLSWSKTWGGTGSDSGSSLVQATDGGYAITGTTKSYGDTAQGDMYIAKFDSSGTLGWSKTLGATSSTPIDTGDSIIKTSDGGYTVAGSYTSISNGSDMFIAKYDSSGNLSWTKTWGGTSSEYAYSLTQATDGGYAIAGKTAGYRATVSIAYSIFLTKTDSSGNIAGCSSPMCDSPTPNTTSPTATTTSPTATTTSPTATTTSPTNTTNYEDIIVTDVVSPSPIAVGTPRAATNTAMTAPDEGTIFRLRLDIHVAGSTVNANASSFKLQYAPKGGAASCSAVATGNFLDVTDSSVVRYADNPGAANGLGLTTGANDPVHGSDTNVAQAYYEKGTTTITNPNSIASGQDGMWDFALQTNQTFQNTTYCLRVVKTGGSLLDTYSAYPELTTPAARFTQAAYRWYDPQSVLGSQTTFVKGLGDSSQEYGYSAVQTSDGGYAVTGNTSSYLDTTYGDMFLAKYDSKGVLSWLRTWGGNKGNDFGSDVIQTSDGGYAITGYTSYGSNANDMFVVKYDSTGTFTWATLWGGTLPDAGNSLVQTSDGGYAVTGYTKSYIDTSSGQIILVKFDSSGNHSWSQAWGDSSAAMVDEGYSVIQTSDGGYAVTGHFSSNTNGYGLVLLKYDQNGTLSWKGILDDLGDETGYSVVQTSDGGYAVTGDTDKMNSYKDMLLAKFDSTGAVSWSKTWGNVAAGKVDQGYSVVQTSDGGYAVAGTTDGFGAGGKDMFLVKYDSTGALSWNRTWGGSADDLGHTVVQTSDGGYAVAGDTSSYGNVGSWDMYLAKFDSSGNISGCSSPMCQNPTVSPGSPTWLSSTPTGPVASSVTPTAGAFGGTSSTPTSPTSTTIVGVSVPAGSPLAAVNVPLDMPSLTPMALRAAVRIDGSGVDKNTQNFKLQYAIRSSEASCSAVAGGLFADVTTSTPIAYYDDARYGNAQPISGDPSDPSDGSRPNSTQTYVELNNFSNAQSPVYAGQNGVWQFSLTLNSATLKGNNFCLRIATSGSTLLTALNVVDVAYGPQMNQLMRGGSWFDRSNGSKQWKSL